MLHHTSWASPLRSSTCVVWASLPVALHPALLPLCFFWIWVLISNLHNDRKATARTWRHGGMHPPDDTKSFVAHTKKTLPVLPRCCLQKLFFLVHFLSFQKIWNHSGVHNNIRRFLECIAVGMDFACFWGTSTADLQLEIWTKFRFGLPKIDFIGTTWNKYNILMSKKIWQFFSILLDVCLGSRFFLSKRHVPCIL